MLRKSPWAVVAVLFLCSLAVPQTPPTWQTFDSPEGRFTILMPSKPKVEVKDIDSAVGKLTMYSYSSNNNAGYYMISFGDYPNEPTDAAHSQRILEGVRGGVLKGLEAEVTTDESIPFEGYPGREFKAKRTVEGSEVIFSWKIVLAGRRLYQVAAVTTTANAQSPDITKYFTSFHLKK